MVVVADVNKDGVVEVQIIGDQTLPFSDRAELRQALEERLGARDRG